MSSAPKKILPTLLQASQKRQRSDSQCPGKPNYKQQRMQRPTGPPSGDVSDGKDKQPEDRMRKKGDKKDEQDGTKNRNTKPSSSISETMDWDTVLSRSLDLTPLNDQDDLAYSLYSLLRNAIKHEGSPFSVKEKEIVSSHLGFKTVATDTGEYLVLVKAGKWRRAIMQLIGQCSGESLGQPSRRLNIGDISRLVRNWRDPYKGSALKALLEKLVTAEKEWSSRYYSKSFNIVQSSGTGKSRLISELGESGEVMVFTVTIRKDHETGFPLNDPEIRSFLTGKEVQDRVVAFLAATFMVILRWYDREQNTDLNHSQIAQKWARHLSPIEPKDDTDGQDFRSAGQKKVCEDIVILAESYLADFRSHLHTCKSEPFESCQGCKDLVQRPIGELKQFARKIGFSLSSHRPLLLLAVDEAANLCHDGNSDWILALQRAMRLVSQYPVWMVLLSTNPALQTLTKAQWNDRSSRVSSREHIRVPPFIGLGLDLENRRVRQTPEEVSKPLNTFSTVGHMTMFGRMLWHTYAQTASSDLIEFVQHKLSGGHARGLNIQNNDHVFALVATRICIDPVLNASRSIELVKMAVDSHLRYLTAFNTDSGYIMSVSPSEPVVVEAAAQFLMSVDNTTSGRVPWSEAISRATAELFSKGLVEKGVKGELYCRLMCILARDYLPRDLTMSFPYSQPFKCADFLRQLTGKEVPGLISEWIVDNADSRRGVRQAMIAAKSGEMPARKPGIGGDLENGYMNFNHFTTLGNPIAQLNFKAVLHEAMRSHSALQLIHSEPYWDIVLPLYFGAPEDAFDHKKLSAVFIQVKNRTQRTQMMAGGEFDRLTLTPGIFAVSLHLDLGATGHPKKEFSIRWPELKQLPSGDLAYDGVVVACLHLHGHGAATFPSLQQDGLEERCIALFKTLQPAESFTLESEILIERDRFRDL